MNYSELVSIIAEILKDFDSEKPQHKDFKPGIGPFGEPQIVSIISKRLTTKGIKAQTKRTPDLEIYKIGQLNSRLSVHLAIMVKKLRIGV